MTIVMLLVEVIQTIMGNRLCLLKATKLRYQALMQI
mgnify:CR=1 FL=1|jgi:hypothetical protein